MSKKRTIDAFFGAPKSKKPRNSEITADSADGHQLPSSPAAENNSTLAYSQHATYPFPIPHLPTPISHELSSLPASIGRAMTDQPDLDLLYFEPYVPPGTAKQLFAFLRSELPFYRVEYDIQRGGNATHIRTPRWTTVFGIDDTARFAPAPTPDDGAAAVPVDARTGSKLPASAFPKCAPRPIPQCLDALRESAEAATGCEFNFCLVNYYASGADSISYHSDDERFLGPLPAIASFSLGARRDFLMKHKPVAPDDSNPALSASLKDAKPLKLPLASGDMILMRGRTQAKWLHSIPKRSGKNETDGGRINITFRKAMVRGGTANYYNYNVGTGPVYKWDAAAREMKQWEL
ncbi:Uu.00g045660.m01.CDS01 [Anthostomella pinea]|uniref:Uu.00g045660.m01.CDS01 n=1 Tax=Anthostomella pinea TaxID=933095 RepID=A0AAI8V652_9PEZI|nr:Uu.00g045660.m01.CDS01 [Anthostomella pinea]